MNNDVQENAGVIAPPPLIYLGSLLLGLLLNRAFPVVFLPQKVARVLGSLLVGSAIPAQIWFFLTMQRARTPISPSEPVRQVVTTGPFRLSRNPAYVSLTILYVGIASLVNTLWPILLLPAVLAVIQRGVIEREERYLERKFGEEYLRYKARVPRWI